MKSGKNMIQLGEFKLYEGEYFTGSDLKKILVEHNKRESGSDASNKLTKLYDLASKNHDSIVTLEDVKKIQDTQQTGLFPKDDTSKIFADLNEVFTWLEEFGCKFENKPDLG